MYSSDAESMAKLRALDGTGKLRTGENNLLPKDDDTTEEIAGYVRAIEMPGLA